MVWTATSLPQCRTLTRHELAAHVASAYDKLMEALPRPWPAESRWFDLPSDRFWVYVNVRIDRSLYVGQTRRPEVRLDEHQETDAILHDYTMLCFEVPTRGHAQACEHALMQILCRRGIAAYITHCPKRLARRAACTKADNVRIAQPGMARGRGLHHNWK